MGLGCLKMVINQNIKLNIDEKYFSSVLSNDEIKFLEDTEFVKELKTEINSIESCLDKIPNFTDIVLIGFGGSSLGTKAIYDSLKNLYELKKIIFIDNLDDEIFYQSITEIDKNKALFLFVSKSGNTYEVISLLNHMLKEGFKKERFHFITQPIPSQLEKFGIKNNIAITNVNENLGGRYSVLSISTFLPLELIGCDWYKIKESALNFYNSEKENSFKICSSLINFYMNNYQNGKNISCFMPYTSRLSSFSEWIMQLFGESLGKKNLGGYPVALTPINYLGPKDQHSQLQLVLDGPPDKTMTFFRVNKNEGLNKYSNIEQRATAQALNEVNVPYIEIELDELDESSLGIIFIIYEIVVSVIGLKLGVNPFDQPAVELIKKKIK